LQQKTLNIHTELDQLMWPTLDVKSVCVYTDCRGLNGVFGADYNYVKVKEESR